MDPVQILDLEKILSLLAYLATIIAAVAVTITAAIYYGQLKAMTKARQLESVLKVFEYADNLDLRRVRYFSYQHTNCLADLPDEPFSWECWNQLDKRIKELNSNSFGMYEIDLWINALNNIGFLIREGYAPKAVLTDHLKNIYLHCDRIFGAYIELRKRRADTSEVPSKYAQHFEWAIQQLKNDKLVKS